MEPDEHVHALDHPPTARLQWRSLRRNWYVVAGGLALLVGFAVPLITRGVDAALADFALWSILTAAGGAVLLYEGVGGVRRAAIRGRVLGRRPWRSATIRTGRISCGDGEIFIVLVPEVSGDAPYVTTRWGSSCARWIGRLGPDGSAWIVAEGRVVLVADPSFSGFVDLRPARLTKFMRKYWPFGDPS